MSGLKGCGCEWCGEASEWRCGVCPALAAAGPAPDSDTRRLSGVLCGADCAPSLPRYDAGWTLDAENPSYIASFECN